MLEADVPVKFCRTGILARPTPSRADRKGVCPTRLEWQTGVSVFLKARTSMVDGFPYKEEVGGSSPSVPTILKISDLRLRSENAES